MRDIEFTCLPEIISSGDLEFDPSWALRSHSSTGAELLHVISGTLELFWEESGEHFTAEAGQTLLNPPKVMHRDNFDFDSGLQILIIQFKWKHFDEFFKTVNNSNINNTCNATTAQLKRLFDDIKLDSGPGENDRKLVPHHLAEIFPGGFGQNPINPVPSGRRKVNSQYFLETVDRRRRTRSERDDDVVFVCV